MLVSQCKMVKLSCLLLLSKIIQTWAFQFLLTHVTVVSEKSLKQARLLLLLLLSHFSHVQLCATPETAAHQAPPSLGFSRQEHWNGLPFPSPTHESEKWKVKVKSLSRVRLLGTPWTAAYQAYPSMGFARQEYWSGLPLPSQAVQIEKAQLKHRSGYR